MAAGYDDATGYPTLIEQWNGSMWTTGSSPSIAATDTGVSCTSASFCMAVGAGDDVSIIQEWNGSSWSTMNSANPPGSEESGLDGVSCISSSFCMAAGDYFPGFGPQTLSEEWNGSTWAPVIPPNVSGEIDVLMGVSCTSVSFCMAVGYSYTASGSPQNLIEEWDGSGWDIVNAPDGAGENNQLDGVSCTSNNFCMAAGSFGGGFTNTLTEVWNGGAWSIVSSPNPSPYAAIYALGAVSCSSPSFCMTVGGQIINNPETLTEEWNGSAWSVVGSPNDGSNYDGLAGVSCTSASFCMADGSYNIAAGSAYETQIAEWDGGGWTDVSFPNVDYQSPLTGGPITSAEEPAYNQCLACSQQEQGQNTRTGDPVNPEFGDLDEANTDISIPGRGIPLEVARTYDSLKSGADGPFGYGWTSNLFMSLSQPGGTGPVTVTQEGGAQVVFDQNGSSYTPAAPRDIATLTQNANGTWTFTRQAQDTYVFSSAGELLSETDPSGYTTTFGYSAGGQLTTVTDPAGRSLQVGWTGGNITAVTDRNVSPARVVTYEYDGAGDLTDVIDVNGGDTHYTYDSAHQMTNLFDPDCDAAGSACNGGNGVVTSYNTSGQVASQQDQLGRTTTFVYTGDPTSTTAPNGTTTITDPVGDVTVDTYEYGVMTEQTEGVGTAQAATTSWTYDPTTAAVTSQTNPNGGTTTYTVDSSGNVLSTTDPLGRRTSATYNSLNEPLTKTDGNGVTTTYTYDAHGNLLTVSTPLVGTSQTQTTTYTYGDSYPGDVTGITNPDGNTTKYTYDADGDQVASTNPVGDTTTTCYNADGWKVASYTPKAGSITCGSTPPASAYETTYSYIQASGQTDGFGDVQKVTAPLSQTTTYTHDADRNLLSTTDADGNTTSYVYDLANEETDVKQANGTDQHTDYTLGGAVADQKDGKGDIIEAYGYNALGQVTTETDALGNVATYTYDGDGNQLTEQAPGGSCPATGCTTMTYDADNELTSVTYSGGTTPNVTNVSYDSDGQRTSMTDGTGTSTWTWNSLHDMTSYTDGAGAEVQYQDNLDGLVTQITYPGNLIVTEGYNAADQWTSTEDWLGHTFTFGYDADGNLTTKTLPAGTSEVDTSAFNAADQLTSITDTKGSSTLFSATYGRNGDDNLTSDSSVPSGVARTSTRPSTSSATRDPATAPPAPRLPRGARRTASTPPAT